MILATLDETYFRRRTSGWQKAWDTFLTRRFLHFEGKNLGFVFQDFNLLDTFSLRDNIYLPLVLAGEDYREMGQKIRPIAQALHIYELLEKYPMRSLEDSKQRCAVAKGSDYTAAPGPCG